METEFRLYGKLNSSYFDLISGEKEPQQTKGLGLLLSKSPTALEIFLRLLFPRQHINKLLNMRCVIDCEAIQKEESKTNKSKRADIIIRFYDGFIPYSAIIVEAKGWNKKASEEQVLNQVIDYCEKFKILGDFNGRITAVTLTSTPILSCRYKFRNIKGKPINITWIDLVNRFIEDNNSKNKVEKELIEDYCNYLLKIGGYMKFYEKEVISIPTQKTIQYVENNEIALYECPNDRRPYTALHKTALYLTFRANEGIATKLYKVSDRIVLRFGDKEALQALDNIQPGYTERLKKYIENVAHTNSVQADWWEEEKQVFFINHNASIELPNPTKPYAQNNTNYPSYYIADYFQKPNSDGYVILPAK